MGGENVKDKPGTHAGNFVRGDSRSRRAPRRAQSPPAATGLGQGDDEVWVVLPGVQLVRAEIHDFVPRATQCLRKFFL